MKNVMQKAFAHLLKFKQLSRHLFFVAAVMVVMAVPAFAVDSLPTFDLAATMTSAVTKLVTDLVGMIVAIFPTVIVLMGASIGVSYGIKFIKGIFAKT